MTGESIGLTPIRAVRLQAVAHHQIASVCMYPQTIRNVQRGTASEVGGERRVAGRNVALERRRHDADGSAHRRIF
jgi:hypothetical protein